MRKLIVNADDLGINAPRNHGIFQAFENGIVTSTSLLPNFPESEGAGKHTLEKKLPTGLHLNLTNATPLSPRKSVGTLLNPEGFFLERSGFFHALERNIIDPTQIERECRAQIEWFFDHVGMPTHVDSHHHIHVHPTLTQILAPLLAHYSIRFVRIPVEPLPPSWDLPEEQENFIKNISAQANTARALFLAHQRETTDEFRGMALVGHASAKHFRNLLSQLPEGTTELMVHPGSPSTTGGTFDGDPQRQTELQMLTDPRLVPLLHTQKITLCSFADLV